MSVNDLTGSIIKSSLNFAHTGSESMTHHKSGRMFHHVLVLGSLYSM